MQVNDIFGQLSRVLEDDGPDWSFPPPLQRLLVTLDRDSEGVQRGGPRRIRGYPPGQFRESPHVAPPRVLLFPKRPSVLNAEGARKGLPEGVRLKPHPVPGLFEQVPAPFDLLLQLALPLADGLEFVGDHALLFCSEVEVLQLGGQRVGLAAPNAALGEPLLDVLVDHLAQAAEFPPNRLRLLDQHLQDPVLVALRQLEVMATHLVGRLKLPVDPPVALLDSAGVPGKVEVEEIGAVGLEVQSLAGRVRGQQDSERIPGRRGVEAALDLLAARPAGQPVNHLDALVGAMRSLNRGLQRPL